MLSPAQATTYLLDPSNLYASANLIMVIKSRKMGWTEHVECIGQMANT
jgi:hypothetical protein